MCLRRGSFVRSERNPEVLSVAGELIGLLIPSETADGDHKEAGEEGSRDRVSIGWETVRRGVRDQRIQAAGGHHVVQGTEKTAEAHHGEYESRSVVHALFVGGGGCVGRRLIAVFNAGTTGRVGTIDLKTLI